MKFNFRYLFFVLIAAVCFTSLNLHAEAAGSIRVGIVGLTHGHVRGFFQKVAGSSIEIVGIVESDQAVIEKYRKLYDLDTDLFTADLNRFLDEKKPEVVWVFINTKAHLKIVEAAAPRGVHVVFEKPLAVDLVSARRMAAMAKKYGTHVLTNLETSWFPSLHETYRLAIDENQLGPITKIVSHFGHPGPVENGVPSEFLTWLTDPVLNGGGASADFGCYGETIIPWMMGNQRPLSVTAVFQTNKPDVYPRVDDNATIILEYPHAQGIIQASWDWTFPRKDIHVYGRNGIIRTIDTKRYDIRLDRKGDPEVKTAAPSPEPHGSSIDYFTAVFHGEIDPAYSLSSIENNLIAMEIMEAARRSAKTGRKITLPLD
jgi:predicted dehydrogenase